MNQKLKKGIVLIFFTNIINLFFSLITSFVLPKHLSIGVYADIKSYQFYINYIGVLHLGFVDGMYLEYGGKTYSEIDKNELVRELSTFRLFQGVIGVLGLGFAVFSRNWTIIFVTLSILPFNMFTCFRSMLQAMGDFAVYSRVINANTVLMFVTNVFCLIFVTSNNSLPYLVSYTVIYVLLWGYLEYHNKKQLGININIQYKVFDFGILISNIKSGILLMFGNLSSTILTGLDRWYVKFFLKTLDFAEYSFAVSIENFINFAVTPITTTLYNYFCFEHSNDEIISIRDSVILFSGLLIGAAYPAKFLLEGYLNKYNGASLVIFFLFGARLFFIIIQSIYVNLYKARKMQKTYFIKLSIVIFSAAVFNSSCYYFWPCKEAFALGTLLSAVLWFLLCQRDFKDIELGFREYIFLFSLLVLFLSSGICFNSVIGGVVYYLGYMILSIALMKKRFISFIRLGKNVIKRKIERRAR